MCRRQGLLRRHGAAETVGPSDLGSLEVGKLADLVPLDANPLEKILNAQTVRRVMKGGGCGIRRGS